MQGKQITLFMVLLTGILVLAMEEGLNAQQIVDMTGKQNLTPEEIIYGFLPRRGVVPVIKKIAISVSFASGSATIPPEATHNLNTLGEALQSAELKNSHFRIIGHTDSRGHDCTNLDLSKRRAASVENYLITKFVIASERLSSRGLGEEVPLADNDTSEGRAKNRRVEIEKIE